MDDLLVAGRRVLDVGCGTGIAGALFVQRGCQVGGVEHDARMAEVARRPGLEVAVSRFEEWDPPEEPFDLVISPGLALDRPGGRARLLAEVGEVVDRHGGTMVVRMSTDVVTAVRRGGPQP